MLTLLRDAFAGRTVLPYLWGVALVSGAGVIFSFTALFFRATEQASDWQFLFYRGISATFSLSVLVYLRRNSRPVKRSAVNARSLLAGVLLAAMSMLFILSLARTTVATAIFLQSAAPFSGAFFGWLLLRERVEARTWVAMAAAVVGVAIMVGAGLEAGSSTGVLMAALLPVIFGLYNVLIKTARESDPLVPALVGSIVLALGSAVMAATNGGIPVSLRDALLGLAAGGVLLAGGLPMLNLGHLSVPTAQVSLLLLTEVVLAPLWVWIWPGEKPAAGILIGGAIVLSAVVALALTAPKNAEAKTAKAPAS